MASLFLPLNRMNFFIDLPFNDYLSSWTLNFKNNLDKILYEKVTSIYKRIFIRLTFCWTFVITILLISLQYNLLTNDYNRLLLVLSNIIVCFLLFVFTKYLKKGLFLDVIYALTFLLINVVFIEYNIPNLINLLQKANTIGAIQDEHFLWFFIYLGLYIEITMRILYVAKIRWYLISICSIVLNTLILRRFLALFHLNMRNGGGTMTLAIPSCILPIFISYLDERTYKRMFIMWKRANENLSSFEHLIESIIPNQVMLIKACQLEVIYLNSKMKNLFEINESISNTNDALLSKLRHVSISNIHNEHSNANLLEKCKELIDHQVDLKEDEFLKFSGSYEKEGNQIIFLDISIGRVRWRNQNSFFILFNDVSSIINLNILKELNEYKDRLLATVSHDLRTPLNAIMGFLDLLAIEIKNKSLLEYIKGGQNSAKMLLYLINDILDYTQITNKKLKLKQESFFLKKIAEDLNYMLDLQFQNKGLHLLCSIDEKLKEKQILGDPQRITQILLNLIGNALKFTVKGKVILVISIQKCAFHHYIHEKVAFSVQDTGIGIEAGEIPKIFKVFKKFDSQNLHLNATGIGLGIPISQNLAILMHEEGIQVESEKNVGSNFSFSIPLIYSNTEENPKFLEGSSFTCCDNDFGKMKNQNVLKKQEHVPTPIDRLVDENFRRNRNLKVLIVDDDMMNIFIHRSYVESIGLRYEEAFNGLEAIEKIQMRAQSNQFFDIILLDCNMPILDGFKAAEKIRDLMENKIIPYVAIVAVTANATIPDLNHCQESGMEYFLGKPVSFMKFKDKMLEILNKFKGN